MADYKPPLRDITFVLDQLTDLDELCQFDAYKHTDPDTMKAVLEENARWVAEVIAPTNRNGDLQGCVHHPDTGEVTTPDGFKEAYRQYVDAGWGAVPFPADYGGGGFPWIQGIAMQEVLTSANLSFSMCPTLIQGAIEAMIHHGSEELKEIYLAKMISGEWAATMNLTEPQAGSDVGAVRTKAEPQPDGTYLVSGTKIFITFGAHDMTEQKIHLVLARLPDAPPGTKGISCFIVPQYLVGDDGSLGASNDVTCVSIEHKMGVKASPTCVMSYGDNGGAVGYLIGQEHGGMRVMFTMMNNARLGVGLQGLAISERAYQDALQYAQERRQGTAIGAPAGEQSLLIEHADIRRMLLTMKSTIEAMRGIIYTEAEAIDIAIHHPDPEIRDYKKKFVGLLTPIAKAWCTDMGVEITSLAVQVYGGMGFIEEAGVAQHYRDARITPVYEGTNGIQAIDLVGRKLPMDGGEVVTDFLSMVAALDPALIKGGDDLAEIRSNLAEALTTLADTTSWMLKAGGSDIQSALAGATPYLRMFSLVTAGWVMARQALAAKTMIERGEGDAAYLRSKIITAQFFCEQVLPQVQGLVAPIEAGPSTLFAFEPELFAH